MSLPQRLPTHSFFLAQVSSLAGSQEPGLSAFPFPSPPSREGCLCPATVPWVDEEEEYVEMNVLEVSETQDPPSLSWGRLWRLHGVTQTYLKTLD